MKIKESMEWTQEKQSWDGSLPQIYEGILALFLNKKKTTTIMTTTK